MRCAPFQSGEAHTEAEYAKLQEFLLKFCFQLFSVPGGWPRFNSEKRLWLAYPLRAGGLPFVTKGGAVVTPPLPQTIPQNSRGNGKTK
jgi:hypothetical protein